MPVSIQESLLSSDFVTVRSASGDSFVTARDPWLEDDAVDLEAMAIGQHRHLRGVSQVNELISLYCVDYCPLN